MLKHLQTKVMLLLGLMLAGAGTAWADSNVSTVSTKFSQAGAVTSNFTQTGDFTNVAWSLGVTWKTANKTYWGDLNSSKGSQIGSGSNPASQVVLTGAGITGTIKSVKVNTSMASGGTITVGVSVGSTAFTSSASSATASLTTSAADYEFSGAAKGDVVITWNQTSTSKAIYIKSVTITYEAAPVYTITATSNDATMGSVTVDGTTITAVPSDGYRVKAGDDGYTVKTGTAIVTNNGDNTFTVTPESACEIVVIFESIPVHTLSSAVNIAGSGVVTLGATSVKEGATTTISALANAGYKFVKWTVAGEGACIEDDSAAETTFTMGSADATVTANYEEVVTHAISWSVNGEVQKTENVEEGVSITFPSTITGVPVGLTLLPMIFSKHI